MPSQCLCGQNYDPTLEMNCKTAFLWHKNVQNFEATLLQTAANDVEIESKLQKIDNEGLDDARTDTRACGVCRQEQNALFDIRFTNNNNHFQELLTVSAILTKKQKRKKTELIIVKL